MKLTPCGNVNHEARVNRLASRLEVGTEGRRKPGECQVCGCALQVAYRAIRVLSEEVDEKTGKMPMECVEIATGSPEQAEYESKVAAGSDGMSEAGWWVMPVHTCASLTEDTWREAKAEIARRQSTIGANEARPPEPPRQERRPSHEGKQAPVRAFTAADMARGEAVF